MLRTKSPDLRKAFRGTEGDVDLALKEGALLRDGMGFHDLDGNERLARTVGTHHPRHDTRGRCRRGHAEHDAAGLAFTRQANLVHRQLQLLQDRLRPGLEKLSCNSEPDLVRAALEQADAQPLLQRLDLHAERGLDDVQLPRGTPEMKRVGENEKIAKLAYFWHADHL